MGNLDAAVDVESATGTTIGGLTPGAGNLIAGNSVLAAGVVVAADDTTVEGNRIGTDATGTRAIGFLGVGVLVKNNQPPPPGGSPTPPGPGDTVGGRPPGAGNLISGNNPSGIGIELIGGPGAAVEGNRVGTDVTGTRATGNLGVGVLVDGTSGATIGGAAIGAGNLIAGLGRDGIEVTDGADGTRVLGNVIGTDTGGALRLGNRGDGIFVDDATDTTVGGSDPGAPNLIAYNGVDGVAVEAGGGNRALQNTTFSNAGEAVRALDRPPADPGRPGAAARLTAVTDASDPAVLEVDTRRHPGHDLPGRGLRLRPPRRPRLGRRPGRLLRPQGHHGPARRRVVPPAGVDPPGGRGRGVGDRRGAPRCSRRSCPSTRPDPSPGPPSPRPTRPGGVSIPGHPGGRGHRRVAGRRAPYGHGACAREPGRGVRGGRRRDLHRPGRAVRRVQDGRHRDRGD